MSIYKLGASSLVLAMCAFAVAEPAMAQDATPPASGDTESRQAVIVVTATKTETTLQETPLTISVVNGADIADRNILEITELAQDVPGLTFSQSPGDLPSIVIRGIGTNNANQTAEQSVGLFVDNVYKPRARQYRDSLFDVERVEVIKGAQGVIFGKNTSVGAISIVSRKPGDEFGGEAYGSYEFENERWTLGGSVDLPASDKLKFRIGGQYSDTGGYVKNLAGGEDLPATERSIIRGTMVAEPTDSLTATLMLQHSEQDTVGTAFQLTEILSPATAGYFGYTAAPYEKSLDPITTFLDGVSVPSESDSQNSTDAVLTLDWALSDKVSLTSVSAFSVMDYENYSSVFYASSDVPGHPKGYQLFEEDFEQFTQELRLSYSGDRWNGFVGAMYQDQDLTFDRTIRLQAYLSPGTMSGGIDIGGFAYAGTSGAVLDQGLEAFSAFGLMTYDATDRFSITGGFRIGYEEKTADFNVELIDLIGLASISIPGDLFLPADQRGGISIFPLLGAFGTVPTRTIDDTSIDGSLNFSYDLTDDWMTYISFAQGTKSAAFNNSTISGSYTPEPYVIPKEVARTIEIGAKGTYANGHGTIGAAAFYSDIADFQDSIYDASVGVTGAFVIRSFDAETYGLEVESRFQATDNLSFYGNLGLLEAKSKTGGEALSDAPKFTGLIGVDYVHPLQGDLEVLAGGRLSASSNQIHRNPDLPRGTGDYQIADFHVGLKNPVSGWSVRAEVKNAFDERYEVFTFVQPLVAAGVVGAYNPPRTVLLSVRKEF